jgi:hypothetical protein
MQPIMSREGREEKRKVEIPLPTSHSSRDQSILFFLALERLAFIVCPNNKFYGRQR